MCSNYLFIDSLAQKLGKCAFYTTAFFGLILVFLTLFGVRKIFGTYKYLIVIFTSFGIFLAGMEVIFHPNLHFYKNGFVFFTLSAPLNIGKRAMNIILSIYAGVISLTIALISVQFMYRYWAIFSIKYLRYFRGWKSLVWVLYCSFFGGIWSVGAYNFLNMDTISEDYFKEEMVFGYDVFPSEIPMLTFLAFDPKEGFVRWWDVMYTMQITLIMSFQYGVMMYCGWNMYHRMEERLENFSITLKHHHRQLFKTLVLQITTPSLFLFSPLVLIIYLPYFQFNISCPAGAVACAFSFYPAMDSIIVLLVVSEYKLGARRLWKSFMQKTYPIAKPSRSSDVQTPNQISLATL